MGEQYKFFTHKECEFYPCHKSGDNKKFNCLFCYCPLYALKENCGGNYQYVEGGIKDCSNCLIPHSEKGYDYIMGKVSALIDMAKKKE
ncbi:cysteine-rich small domain-containing protein [Lutispora thermophila]|uniref:Cysteine-rich small domain-containing protein n=1 Tax=Lutispora thermophila DSM 19022 TaxID=1122184 RepID=A0A1M6DBD2_9FIRM|nr:cysteine-rich small domain-containing protein [Lutispora thermophila]SHI70411.1 Cysteine-rich small domain-containing protein [Lutispora thermophila DSM 19022]